MNTLTESCLREIIDLKFEKVDIRFELNEKSIALQKTETEKALQIQVKELERRLENLNNEAARIKAMEVKYIQSDLFEAKYAAQAAKIENLSKLVYIGVGVVGILEVIIWLLLK